MNTENTDRRVLEDWEKAECLALKEALARYNASVPRSEKFTQDRLAAELGMAQGNLNGHLNGRRPLNKEMAAKIFALTGIPPKSYSERLSKEITDFASSVIPEPLKPNLETMSQWEEAADSLLLEVTSAISVIAAHASTRSLTKHQVDTLLKLRNDIVHMNVKPGVSISKHMSGLIGAAFKNAENGESPDDLISMIKHGADKEHLKEQSSNVLARPKKSRSKSD